MVVVEEVMLCVVVGQARTVAAATHSLCEASNAVVLGHAGEEKLIASAKEVAGSTAQLLMACKVKADMGSIAMQRLQVSVHVDNVLNPHFSSTFQGWTPTSN